MEQLNAGTNDLPSVAKKKVTVAVMLVSSKKVSPAVVASILGQKLGEGYWKSGLDGRLKAVVASNQLKAVAASIQLEVVVAATSKAARLQETLPMASQVLDPYENPVT
jgi:hypothetical protein